jgi:hypothetical protein
MHDNFVSSQSAYNLRKRNNPIGKANNVESSISSRKKYPNEGSVNTSLIKRKKPNELNKSMPDWDHRFTRHAQELDRQHYE